MKCPHERSTEYPNLIVCNLIANTSVVIASVIGCEECRKTWPTNEVPQLADDVPFLVNIARDPSEPIPSPIPVITRKQCHYRPDVPTERPGCCEFTYLYECGHPERGGRCTIQDCQTCDKWEE